MGPARLRHPRRRQHRDRRHLPQKNGLLPVIVDASTHRWLLDNPGAQVRIDLETTTLEANGERVSFPIDRFSRYCLMNGIDQLGFLLEQRDAIARYEQAHA
jgi:3-isopropylmalate/(R)-2-methylmalate dehydratase small subunit